MKLSLVKSLVAFLACAGVDVDAEDWPHWRGASHNGHVAEASGYKSTWPGSPAWTANVGEGSSSPLVVGEHVYTIGHRNGRDVLSCLDLSSGKSRWEASFAARRYARHATGDEAFYAGPTATPWFDRQQRRLYLLSADGWLRCLDADQRGKEVWSLNLYERYAVAQRPKVARSGVRDYGYTSSPLVHGDWLLVEVGATRGLVLAFDKHTGAEVWASEHAEPAGHTGAPVVLDVQGVPCLAVLALTRLVVMRLDGPSPGRTIGTFSWPTEWANNISTPAARDGCVLIGSRHTYHAVCKLKVTLEGLDLQWKQPYASYIGSPVNDGDHVYLCGQELYCLDWSTGRLLWSGGAFVDGGSCIKTGDDRLIVLGSKGVLALVDTARRSPGKYEVLAHTPRLFGTDAWPHVVLAHGRILCKDRDGNIKCFAP